LNDYNPARHVIEEAELYRLEAGGPESWDVLRLGFKEAGKF
jgi:hypothetical protein